METKLNLNLNDTLEGVKDVVFNFIVPIVSLFIVLLLVLLVLMPSYREIPDLKNQLEARTLLNSQLDAKLANLNKLTDYKSVIEEDSNLINDVLVQEPRVPQLLTQIDQMAREAGLVVNRLSYSIDSTPVPENEAPTAFRTVTVNLVVSGSHTQFIDFMKAVENAARLVSIDNFRYAADTGVNSDNTEVSYTVNLSSPYLYVQSNAVTDDVVALDIGDKPFLDLMNKLKSLRFYKISIEDVKAELVESAKETSPSAETPSVPAQ